MVKLLLLTTLVACRGDKPAPIARDATVSVDAVAITVDASTKNEEPEPPDPGKLIADLGAISAWEAVIDRGELLARRGDRGVAYGRLGAATGAYTWLVDDTEGNGALGIRVMLGKETAKAGDRVALAGAWVLDDERRWYWKVDTLHVLPAAPASDVDIPAAPEPSHVIRDGNLTSGSRTITLARDNDPVYFQIVGPPPTTEGDGWLVANELGDTPFALLTLPGERPSYGGHDMRAPDERWLLKKGATYWVKIGKIRRRDDKPALIKALTAPVRVN